MSCSSQQLKQNLLLRTYPSEFFYNKRQSGEAHTTRNTGDLDLQFLVDSKPNYWFDLTQPSSSIPKQLILVDWRKTISPDLLEKRSCVTEKLLLAGFIIWRLNNETDMLAIVTQENLHELETDDVRESMSLYEYDELYQMASIQLTLARDAVHILDDYWMDHLINKDKIPQTRRINLSDVCDNEDHPFFQRVQGLIPPLININEDVFSEKGKKNLAKIKEYLPGIAIVPSYIKIVLTSKELTTLLSHKQLNRDESVFELAQLANLLELTIKDNGIIPGEFRELLIRATKLTYLSFYGQQDLIEIIDTLSVSTVKNLRIRGGKLSQNLLQKFKSFTQMNRLCWSSTDSVHDSDITLNPCPRALPKLTDLFIVSRHISANNIKSILEGAPNLIRLNLELNIIGQLELEKGSLPHLKTLISSEYKLSINQLNSILAAAPNLCFMDIKVANNLDYFDLMPNCLPKLKAIKIIGSKITSANLSLLLQSSLEITELYLHGTSIAGDNLVVNPNNFRKLKKLTIDNNFDLAGSLSYMPVKLYKQLLIAAPNLESLKIIDLCIKQGIDSEEPLNTSEIKFNRLTTLQISGASFVTNLLYVTDLSRLTILDIDHQEISGVLPKGCLASTLSLTIRCETQANFLENIACAAPNIRMLTLEKLEESELQALAKLPKLSHLFFNNVDFENIDLKAVSKLTSLNKLTVKDCAINPETLAELLLITPNIRYFNWIFGDYDENVEFDFGRRSLMNLRTICIGDDDGLFSIDYYKYLKMAAPTAIIYKMKNDFSFLRQTHQQLVADELHYRRENEAFDETDEVKEECKPTSAEDESFLDADTTDTPQTYRCKRIFYPIGDAATLAPTQYRLEIFNVLIPNPDICDVNQAFIRKRSGDLLLQMPMNLPCVETNTYPAMEEKPSSDDDSYNDDSEMPTAAAIPADTAETDTYYGKQTIHLTNKWQALASLSPHETMLRYHMSHRIDIDLGYSNRDNMYYIRSRTDVSKRVKIDFILEVPRNKPELSEEIQRIVEWYQNFDCGVIDFEGAKDMDGQDYCRIMQGRKKGACRHRSALFKLLINQRYPDTPVRIVDNIGHSFVEIYEGEHWHLCDLGGYYAELVIDESNDPFQEQESDLDEEASASDIEEVIDIDEVMKQELLEEKLKKIDPLQDLTLKEFCERFTSNSKIQKQLIQCQSEEEIHALHFAFQRYCRGIQQPIFYASSPEALVCSSPYIDRRKDTNLGSFKKGPSGYFYEFLKAAEQAPQQLVILMVNYANFESADIIRTNELLDEHRTIDTITVPDNVIIIGFNNTSDINSYQGNDFTSRFDTKDINPYRLHDLESEIPSLPITTQVPARHPEHREGSTADAVRQFEEILPGARDDVLEGEFVIKLYNAGDWERRLLGQWRLDDAALIYQDGLLSKLFSAGAETLVIENGLWNTPAFLHFWQEAYQSKTIKHAGRVLNLPQNFKLICRDGYDWQKLTTPLQQVAPMRETYSAELNPTKLSGFFGGYHVENASIKHHKGLIEATANGILQVTLTRTLSEDQWAQLLDECSAHGVLLQVQCLPQVELPKAMLDIPNLSIMKTELKRPAPRVINSIDIELTLAQLSHAHPDALIIDVSECSSADLLLRMNGKFNHDTLSLEFNENRGVLLTAMDQGRQVILKGTFSEDLSDSLALFLLESHNAEKLVLVSDDTQLFRYCSPTECQITVEDKRLLVGPCFSDELLHTESLSQLLSRQRYALAFPGADTTNAWEGLHDLKGLIEPLEAFCPHTSVEKTIAHTQHRATQIKAMLTHAPYVFLSGLSGVGKSTFVQKDFGGPDNKYDVILHQNMSNLEAWANDKTPDKTIVIFIDEANLLPSEMSQFDGMFRTPPFIVINGIHHPLTANHKVVFAGNPVSYGDERRLAPFFEQHGNAVVFQPLPTAVIYEKILKPVFFEGDMLDLKEDEIHRISAHIIDAYRFLCQCSQTEVLISPRELQMMALIIRSYHQRYPRGNIANITRHFVCQIAKPLVPVAKQEEFNQIFGDSPLESQENTVLKKGLSDYVLTPSRQEVCHLLTDVLALRESRQCPNANGAQRYGGLNGVIIEGPSGIGKSQLVSELLEGLGFSNIRLRDARQESGKYFYKMPATMSFKLKCDMLLTAFDNGDVIVIDEINSSPMMEELLNTLLMGKSPQGKEPTRAGFTIVGTQNPPTMGGRCTASTALLRRLITVKLPAYTSQEMLDILTHQGIPAENARTLLSEHGSSTCREILRTAKQKQLLVASPMTLGNAPSSTPEISSDVSEPTSMTVVACQSSFFQQPLGLRKALESPVNDSAKRRKIVGVVVRQALSPDSKYSCAFS